MSTPNPLLVAAVPSLSAALTAMKTFVQNLGTDPAQVALKFPGAAQVFVGSIELQGPALASAEFGAAQTAVLAKIDSWNASIEALAASSTSSSTTPK
jgi:hypothetical protein